MKRILFFAILFFPLLAFSQTRQDSVGVKTISSLTELTANIDTSYEVIFHDPSTGKISYRASVGEFLKTINAISGIIGSSQIVNGSILDTDISGSAGIGLNKLATTAAGRLLLTDSGGAGTWVSGTPGYGLDVSGTSLQVDTTNEIASKDYVDNLIDDVGGGNVTSDSLFFVEVSGTTTAVDQGDTLSFDLASAGITGGTAITADGTDDIDLSNYFFAKIGLGSVTSETLTLSTPSNYFTYNIHFSGVSQDTVVFPSNFLIVGGDSIGTRVLTDDIIISFYYDGTNFYTPSGFGLAQNLLISMFAAMFKGMEVDTIISPFMLGQFQPIKIGEQQIGADNHLNEAGDTQRSSTTFANTVFYDSIANVTWISLQGDNSTGRSSFVYGLDHNKKNQTFRYRVPAPNIANDDTHQRGSFYLTPSGKLGMVREDEHVSPMYSYTSTGTNRDTLTFAATSTDSTSYYQPFYFRDTLIIAHRNTSKNIFLGGGGINNAPMFHELLTSTDGENFTVFRRLTEDYFVENSPYLTVAYDMYNQDIAYYIGNSRLYGTNAASTYGPIYYNLWIYKAFYPSGTLYSIDETYTADTVTTSAVYSDLMIEQLPDSTSGNLEIGHFYVDESNDLHLVYWNATDGYVKFLKTNGTSYTIDTIPGLSAPTNEGAIGLTADLDSIGVQDFITFAYIKPNVYDLFYYSDDTGSGYTVKKYRTIDGFSSIDGGEVISPSGALVRSMRMTTNYKPGRPCVIAMEAQYPSSNENDLFLFTYTYTPQ